MTTATGRRTAEAGSRRGDALRDAVALTAVVASGLVAGSALLAWLLDAALADSARHYIEYRQATTAAYTWTVPPLGAIALVTAGVSALLGTGRGRTLALVATACLVAALAVTVLLHFPLDAQILGWSAAAPPADWRQVRDSWIAAHAVRTLLTVAAFALLAVVGRNRRA